MNAIRDILAAGLILATAHWPAFAAAPSAELTLWPGKAPGDKGELEPERDMTKESDNLVAGKRLIRLGNVSKPSIAVYQPAPEKRTGTAVIVCPGGGYQILAMDLEGTEVCEWLNSIGVTGVLLKYRVPKRTGLEKHTAALQDAQRAIGLVRLHAADWGIHTNKIGILGFSAGGHLAALASNQYESRTYPSVDEADTLSCRPDFTLLIYPAYLTVKEQNDRIAAEFNLTSNTPPTFMAMAEDDPIRVETVLFYAAGLEKAKVPLELHVYPTGGHGYGLRPAKDLVTTWPQRAADWMRSRGLIQAH
ncbi:MAG TPA: alpha/beta hydrolase [Verrucomicrobiae bacterium]|nr:alpha/beta hydrolase [Verrucomicrobiae bacterium]